MRHKHYDKIIPWANSVDNVVVLFKCLGGNWEPVDNPSWDVAREYRVCATQHVEVVLAKLNDPSIQLQVNDGEVWVDVDNLPRFESATYRVKPTTIRIGKYDVPAPLSKPAEEGKHYYFVNLIEPEKALLHRVNPGVPAKPLWFCHQTKEAAVLHAIALNSLTKPEQ